MGRVKVLYFIFEGFDTTNGTNHLALTTIQTFLDNGIDVYLMTSHSKGLFPDIPELISARKGFTYSIIPRNKVAQRNFVQRYLDGMKYAIDASKEWKKHRSEIDVVVLQSTPTVFFSAYLLQRYLKKPVIFNSFDVFPDGPYLFGAISNKFVYHVLSLMQDYVYKTSEKIVVISRDMGNVYLKKGINKNRIRIIPIWYDSDLIGEISEENNKFIKKFGIDRHKFIVQYAGNFGYTFDFKAVIEVAKLLRDEDNIEFHMIGTGGFEKEFKEKVASEKLKNIKFFPWQDSSIISDVYSACDIEFIPLSRQVIWTSYPSKTALLMACGRSFICMCEDNSHFYKFVNKYQFGICTPNGKFNKVAKDILNLYKNKSELIMLNKRAKKIGYKYYSSQVNASKYVDLVKEIVKE